MTDQSIIKTTRTITFTTTTKWPEDYPGMDLASAITYEKDLDLEEIMLILQFNDDNLDIKSEVRFNESAE